MNTINDVIAAVRYLRNDCANAGVYITADDVRRAMEASDVRRYEACADAEVLSRVADAAADFALRSALVGDVEDTPDTLVHADPKGAEAEEIARESYGIFRVQEVRDAGYRGRELALYLISDDDDAIRAFRNEAAAAGGDEGVYLAETAMREHSLIGPAQSHHRLKVAGLILDAYLSDAEV